jgi:DNA/RNA-binding domain of Phe-tRNA-synthetase-like protein
MAAWRAAYRAFGAKPSRTRNSAEALAKRALGDGGLPRVNRLVDLYNAVSVAHLIPVGGEDLDRIRGAMRLVRATGDEEFPTAAGGEDVVEHPEPGEVVWRDDEGVTCRRWNWRQGTRTRLTGASVNALFLLERMAPMTLADLEAAAAELAESLLACCPGARVEGGGAAGRVAPPGRGTPRLVPARRHHGRPASGAPAATTDAAPRTPAAPQYARRSLRGGRSARRAAAVGQVTGRFPPGEEAFRTGE